MNSFKLAAENNDKLGPDEMEGEYPCKRCKGWGFINETRKPSTGLTAIPVILCPECDGGGIIDWIKRATQN